MQETQWHVPAEGFTPWQQLQNTNTGPAGDSSTPLSAEHSAAGLLQGSPASEGIQVTGLAADLLSLSLGSHTRFDEAGLATDTASRPSGSSQHCRPPAGPLQALTDTARCA